MLVFDTVSSELPLVSNGKSLNFQRKNAFFLFGSYTGTKESFIWDK